MFPLRNTQSTRPHWMTALKMPTEVTRSDWGDPLGAIVKNDYNANMLFLYYTRGIDILTIPACSVCMVVELALLLIPALSTATRDTEYTLSSSMGVSVLFWMAYLRAELSLTDTMTVSLTPEHSLTT